MKPTTLIDQMRATLAALKKPKSYQIELRKRFARASSFVCSEEFTRMVAVASTMDADKLMALAEHARPRQEAMFIEWSSVARIRGLAEGGHSVTQHDDKWESPRLCGILIIPTVSVDMHGLDYPGYDAMVFTSESIIDVPLLPVAYTFTIGGPAPGYEKGLFFTTPSNTFTNKEFLFTTKYLKDNISKSKIIDDLSQQFIPGWAPGMGMAILKATETWSQERITIAMMKIAGEQSGDARWIIALLGLMNIAEIRYSEPQTAGSGRFLFNRHSVPYSVFKTIDLVVPVVDRIKYIKKVIRGAWRNKHHNVDGHYRHYRDEDGTVRKSVWIKPHERGDKVLGSIVKVHKVKSTKEAENPATIREHSDDKEPNTTPE